jgi:hypothetical protein
VLGRARVEVRRSGGGLKEEEVGKTLQEMRVVEQNQDDHPETYMCARVMGHHTRKPCQIGRFSLPRVRAMMQHDAQAAHSGSDGPFFPFRPVFWQCAIANHEQYQSCSKDVARSGKHTHSRSPVTIQSQEYGGT